MSPYWKMFEPRVPGFVHIPTCYPYRQEGAKPGETAGQTAARLLEEAIVREGADTVAAFIAEPIHGGGGVLYPTDDYFPLVRKVCDQHDVLFIADEVITGFCRTGKWFALEHWNVQPGHPLLRQGRVLGLSPAGRHHGLQGDQGGHGRREARRPLDARLHLLGASHLLRGGDQEPRDHGARAALGARGGHGQAAPRGAAAAFGDHPHVGDIRGGKGLLAAVELVEDRATKKMFDADKKVGPRLMPEMTKRGRDHAGPPGAHLLLAAADHQRGAGRPPRSRSPATPIKAVTGK